MSWRYWNQASTAVLLREISQVLPWSRSWRWIALVLLFRRYQEKEMSIEPYSEDTDTRPWELIQVFNAAEDTLNSVDKEALRARYEQLMNWEPKKPDNWEGVPF